MWDDEVAVVAVGAGPGGLAYALAVADVGADVLIATPPSAAGPVPGDDGRGWLPGSADPLSDGYLSELVNGIPPIVTPEGDALTDRIVRLPEPPSPKSRRVVETFVGARLPRWAAQCLGSPHGAVLTRVEHWPQTRLGPDGRSIGIAPIGRAHGGSLSDWMHAEIRERAIPVLEHATLQRLVFEDDRLAGVVMDTPDGEYAVRATFGVSLSPAAVCTAAPVDGSELALVGLAGSRFIRLETIRTED